jgi:hypothetical protein
VIRVTRKSAGLGYLMRHGPGRRDALNGPENGPTLNHWRKPMRSIIKTVAIAAIGAAVISGSPAFAKRSDARTQGYTTAASGWQVQAEYLKDAPAHNGNNY